MRNPFVRKPIRKGELRDVDIKYVSLLFDNMTPVNQKGVIVKGVDGKAYTQLFSSTKIKKSVEGTQGRLYVTLMEPGVKDLQGDVYDAQEVVKACDRFARNGSMLGRNDANHNRKPMDDFYISESYILKAVDKENFPDTALGSFVQCIKCDDLQSDGWKRVEKGLNGVSIDGEANDYGDHGGSNAELITELKAQHTELLKALGSNPAPEMKVAVEKMESRIKELEKANGDDATTKLIKAFTDEMKELTVSIKKAISKSLKGEPGDGTETDREVMIDGNKIIVKASHKEIYKGISQVDAGAPMNILTPNTTSLFIDEVVGSQPGDTLADITVVPLLKDETIDAGVIADLIFTNSLDAAAAAQDVASASIACATGILTAEFTLGRDIVEFYKDKYGEDAFGAYVEQHIAMKAEKAIRLLLFRGDRAAAAGPYKALNGIIKLATTAADIDELVDETLVTWDEKFEAALLQFEDAMLEDQEQFKFYVSHKDLIRIRSEIARRETVAGDRFLLEGGNVSFAGIPVKPRLMPDDYIIGGLPKFIIIGYRTDAELKVEHHGSDWKYHWYIRIRPGITYVPDFIKIFHVV